MNLYDLSTEYLQTANKLQARIIELKKQQKQIRGPAALEMKKRIETLYSELMDLRIIMAYLRNYYD